MLTVFGLCEKTKHTEHVMMREPIFFLAEKICFPTLCTPDPQTWSLFQELVSTLLFLKHDWLISLSSYEPVCMPYCKQVNASICSRVRLTTSICHSSTTTTVRLIMTRGIGMHALERRFLCGPGNVLLFGYLDFAFSEAFLFWTLLPRSPRLKRKRKKA